METNKILNADILDIIFEGKNKSYGAYELRKTYNARILKSLLFIGVLLLLVLGGFLLSKAVGNSDKTLNTEEVQMAEVKKEDIAPPVVPPPPPPKPPPPPEIKQIQFTPPVIKKDNEIKKDEKIEEIKEDQAISEKTVVSENTTQIVQAPVVVEKSEVVEAPVKKVEDDAPFTKVEIEAEFPGGQAKWKKYLESNLNGQVTTDNNAPPGVYQVIVRFIVAKDGAISDVVAETSHGYGMEAEAVRAIKKGPKWTPAQQNGNIVKAYRRQPITFQVTSEE
jgi:periplasmic protein TonB